MRYFLVFIFFGYCILFVSCKKYKPAPEAFFISSSKVAVTTATTQGSGSNKITDLFLYVNGKFQGAYPVGHLMPIVNKNSNARIDVFAGIKNNGIKDLTISWILYDKITFDTLLTSGSTISRPFTFKYNPNVTFVWQENFDNPIGFSLIKSANNSDTTFKIASAVDSFEGKSAELGLTGTSYREARLESAVSYTLPKGNSNVYLELDYKCTEDFEVGVTDGVNLKGAVIVKPQANWNKIYIQLAGRINDSPVSNAYKIYFRLIKPNGTDAAHVWLDNIKLVYL